MSYLSLLLPALLMSVNLFSQAQVVPCQLTNPDQDTLRLFPERTNYRAEFVRIDQVEESRNLPSGQLYHELEQRLADRWDPVWETKDIPYVFYEILKGKERIGWVFGANQGWPGADNSQIMIGFDVDGRIREFYFQKLPSLEKAVLQTKEFYSQFIGLTLEHFYVHERLQQLKISDPELVALDMVQRISDPTKSESEGFAKTLRGLKKVLVFLDDFKLNNRIKKDEVFKNIDYIVKNKNIVSLLTPESAMGQGTFSAASRYVFDILPVEQHVLQERVGLPPRGELQPPIQPVYVVYQDQDYKAPFVRGITLGYVLPANGSSFVAVVAVGAQENFKGKICSLKIDGRLFPKFQGVSLTHFYTKDYLVASGRTESELDKIAPLNGITIDHTDISTAAIWMAKRALVLADEFYFHNFFKKEEIVKKVEEYLKNKEK